MAREWKKPLSRRDLRALAVLYTIFAGVFLLALCFPDGRKWTTYAHAVIWTGAATLAWWRWRFGRFPEES